VPLPLATIARAAAACSLPRSCAPLPPEMRLHRLVRPHTATGGRACVRACRE